MNPFHKIHLDISTILILKNKIMKQLHTLAILLAITFTTSIQAQDLKIYVSDAENFAPNTGKILQYDIDGSNPITFIDEELSWPQDIVFLADQNVVLISNLNSNKITKHNAVTGAYIEDFALVAGGPTRMKIGSDNLLYVLQWSATDNKVLRFQQIEAFPTKRLQSGEGTTHEVRSLSTKITRRFSAA